MANRYWVGGSGTWDASDTTHWSATSGGSGGASVPGASDAVIFNAGSGGGTIIVNAGQVRAGSFNSTGFTGSFSGSPVNVTGSVTLGVDMSMTANATSSVTLTSNGHSIGDSYLYHDVICTDALTALGISLSSSSSITLLSGSTNTVSSIVWPSSSGAILKSSSAGTRATILDASGTNYVDNTSVTDIAFAGGATWYWGTGYTNVGNNTGISSPPAANTITPLFMVFA